MDFGCLWLGSLSTMRLGTAEPVSRGGDALS